ncbi:MAG: ABC transporter ATP-binding protein [Chloroflexi bacterium]|nr:ABC transporter ATP-binding protein [Chloroflexota bacterium]
MASTNDLDPMSPLLEMSDVCVTYSGASNPTLDGMNLTVRQGEFLAILGQSGSGKTTALRAIAGFERIERGQLAIGGKVVADAHTHVKPENRRVGMVFQDYALFPHLSVMDNVAFGVRDSGSNGKANISQALEMVGLSGYEHRYPHELSGGQQQRVALARSLAPDPVILLLDEPFSNLDRQLRGTLRRDVREIVQSHGTTAVLVTHDREEALGMADRVAIMDSGRVLQIGQPVDLYTNANSSQVAQLIAPSNTVRGRIAGPYVDTEAGRFRYRSPTGALGNGVFVDAVLRAHDLELGPWEGGGAVRTVSYREYQGEFTEYGIELPSQRRIYVRRRSIAPLEIGSRVVITAPFDRPVLVYPEQL